MSILFKIFSLTLVLLLMVSCGSNQTSTTLEVSHAFQMTNPNFGGGLIIYGENTTGKKFSLAIDASLQGKVSLESGSWTFYAMGWDGSTGNYKFEGQTYCGKTVAEVSSSNASVSINVDTATCVSANFEPDTGRGNVFPKMCGTFYSYNGSTDTYTEVSNASDLSGHNCNTLPLAYQSEYAFFRVVAFDQTMPGSSATKVNLIPKFTSECKTIGSTFILPTKKFPLAFRAYKTASDCAAQVKENPFRYPNGIDAGGEDFGHKYYKSGTSSYILLPSSVSRQGISPLMSVLPRVLCGTSGSYSDCVSQPSSTYHVRVPWVFNNMGFEKQVLAMEGTTSCPSTLNSNQFEMESCEIDDGKMKASVFRNELTCQETGSFSNMVDVYRNGSKIYILKTISTNYWVDVFTTSGKKITSYQLPGTNYANPRVSADNLMNLWVSYYDGTNNRVDKHTFNNGSMSYSTGFSFNVSFSIEDIELSSDGSQIFLAHIDYSSPNYYYHVTPYDTAGSAGTDRQVGLASNNSQDIQIKSLGSTLYAMTTDNTFDQMSIGSLALGTPAAKTLSPAQSNLKFFDIFTDKIVLLKGSGGAVSVHDMSGTQLKTFTSGATTPVGIAYNNFYPGKMAIAGPTGLMVYDATVSTPADMANAGTSCTGVVTVAGQSINIKSAKNDSYEVYNHALEMIGTRSISSVQPRYLFETLNKDHDAQGGGILRRAQEHMSSVALGGFLGKYSNTCTGLMAAADARTGAQITDSTVIYDRKDNKYLTINMTIKKIAQTMTNTYFCVPGDPTASTCSNTFDLELLFTITQTDRNEAIRMKIDCDNKIGSFESREIESGTGARTEYNLLEWSTGSAGTKRAEEYRLGIENSRVSASITKIEQPGSPAEFWTRKVDFGFEGTGSYGSAREIHGYSTNIGTASANLKDTTPASFFSNLNTGFATARGSDSLYNIAAGSATSCMASVNTDPFTVNVSSCAMDMSGPSAMTSHGLDMKLDSFSDLSGGTTSISSSAIRAIFTIP